VNVRLHPVAVAGCFATLFFCLPVHGQTLQALCDRLEGYAKENAFQQGVDQCRETGGHDAPDVVAEADPLVQERYLHIRADLCQSFADILTDQDHIRLMSGEAFDDWVDYFEWFSSLEPGERRTIMNSTQTLKGRKILSAAAALGATAISAARPLDACVEYEALDEICFGPQALNWWLAALMSPNVSGKINNQIFAKAAENQKILSDQVSDQSKIEHWRRFLDRLDSPEIKQRLSHGAQNFIERLRKILPQSNTVTVVMSPPQ
jgi:hypothetical protein